MIRKGLNSSVWLEVFFHTSFLFKYFYWNSNKNNCILLSWKVAALNSWLNQQYFPLKGLKMKMSEYEHDILEHIHFRNLISFELVKIGVITSSLSRREYTYLKQHWWFKYRIDDLNLGNLNIGLKEKYIRWLFTLALWFFIQHSVLPALFFWLHSSQPLWRVCNLILFNSFSNTLFNIAVYHSPSKAPQWLRRGTFYGSVGHVPVFLIWRPKFTENS